MGGPGGTLRVAAMAALWGTDSVRGGPVTGHVSGFDEVVDLGRSTVCGVEASGYSSPDGPSS